MTSRLIRILVAVASVAAALSCDRLDNQRIPPAPVHLAFTTVGDWNIYGVGGALDYRIFIKDRLLPAGYPYTAVSATGFGGILLVADVNGVPCAYDLSCPVECRRDVTVAVDTHDMVVRCSKCQSTFDVFSLGGHPLTGPAARDGFGLRRYNVAPAPSGYKMVTN